jgi:hypothetical protein
VGNVKIGDEIYRVSLSAYTRFGMRMPGKGVGVNNILQECCTYKNSIMHPSYVLNAIMVGLIAGVGLRSFFAWGNEVAMFLGVLSFAVAVISHLYGEKEKKWVGAGGGGGGGFGGPPPRARHLAIQHT